MGRLNRYIWFLVMIIIGAGLGLYYSWFIKPPEFVDAVFPNLRMDYKTDYVLMAAEIYDKDHNRLDAVYRLDNLLYQNELREEFIESAIENARQLGYNPIDLMKMENLYKAVTGQNATPTPTANPTKEYSSQMTATAVAEILKSGSDDNAGGSSSGGAGSSGGDPSVPQADLDPFGTGIQVTTDPNALPELDLPSMPTITPNPGLSSDDSGSGRAGTAIPVNTDNFGGLPDDFFEGR